MVKEQSCKKSIRKLKLYTPEQSGYVTAALRHLHAAQLAAADESRATARQLSTQQQVGLISPLKNK